MTYVKFQPLGSEDFYNFVGICRTVALFHQAESMSRRISTLGPPQKPGSRIASAMGGVDEAWSAHPHENDICQF